MSPRPGPVCRPRPHTPAAAGPGGTSTSANRVARRTNRPRTRTGAQVLKMLTAMEQTPGSDRDGAEQDFLTTGRTGRRNAMADILGEHANTGSGEITEHMERLSFDQPGGAGPSGSSTSSGGKAASAPPPAPAPSSGSGSSAGQEEGR